MRNSGPLTGQRAFYHSISPANGGASPPSKTPNHPFVNLARNSHVIEVVLANLRELSRLVELENFAAFCRRCLARFDTQRPGDVVETHKSFRAQPPRMHCVEYSPNPVFSEIDYRPGRNAMDQAALEDKRQIESEEVVPDKFVGIRIEGLHVVEKSQQRFFFVLLFSVMIDAEHALSFALLDSAKVEARHRTLVNCN